jgi:transposase
MLRYDVITSGYVEGMTTRQIVVRYGISESTLHRYRRDGVRVLAQELGEQEARFSREPPDAATG